MFSIKSKIRDPINLAFLASIIYWVYLGLTTKMIIVYDAATYEALGKRIVNQGWIEFFRTGPNREPFYPALIAFSMGLGKSFGISYQFIQALIQLLILFLTQVLTLRILRLLKINNLLSALTILYLGISPAIVNSALSLFSEIATYPLILTIMLLIYRSWLSFTGPRFRIILLAIATSLLFVLMILNKGIFELVTPVFFFLFILSALLTRNRKLIVNAFVYLVVVLGVFYSLVIGYKSANEIFNGHFVIANRGAWGLYGSTARRMEPLTNERFLTALAFVPGEGVCHSIFGEEKCRFWSFEKAGEFGSQKISELNRSSMPPEVVDSTLILLSKQKVLQNPAQYVLLVAMEGLRMFFWESTQVGFVEYPFVLRKLFDWRPFKDGLRLVIALLTLLAFAYLGAVIWRGRKNILKTEGPLLFLYFCLLFIFSFIGAYLIFGIIVRYLFPIVPLYLIIIAYTLQEVCFLKEGKVKKTWVARNKNSNFFH